VAGLDVEHSATKDLGVIAQLRSEVTKQALYTDSMLGRQKSN
jgi:hypothetical protein